MGKYLDLVLCFMTNQAPFLRTSQLLMLPLMSFSVGAGELQPLHYCHCMPLSPPGLSRRDIPLTLSIAGLFSAPEPHNERESKQSGLLRILSFSSNIAAKLCF